MGVTHLRQLLFDIETAPGTAYYWRPKTNFITHNMIIDTPFMICWSAKYAGQRKVYSEYLTPDEVEARDASRIANVLADMFSETDYVIAHNGDNFDVPIVNGELWKHDGTNLPPVGQIDTKKLSAKHLGQTHNNLDFLAKVHHLDQKIKTDFSWWTDILEGSEQAMTRMVRYNRKDVTVLEDVYNTMKPYVRLPRLVTSTSKFRPSCPYCGSDDVTMRGRRHTRVYSYRRFQCNLCKKYSTERINDQTSQNPLAPT